MRGSKYPSVGEWNSVTMVLEICVDSVESAIASQAGGAQRIELCSDLTEGGITPSPGMIQAVRKRVAMEIFVMVRPRGGDSFYTGHEYDAMRYDVVQIKLLGADGVVLGLLKPDGQVDVERTRELVKLAHPMQATFHRAFDMSSDLDASLSQVMETGAHRILTSGGMQSIAQGADRIAHLIAAAKGKIQIMVGGGLRQENIHKIALLTGAREFHCSLRTKIDSPITFRNRNLKLGTAASDEFSRFVVQEGNVRKLRRALDKIANGELKSVSK